MKTSELQGQALTGRWRGLRGRKEAVTRAFTDAKRTPIFPIAHLRN
jgi:hypothetical protein